MEVEKEVEEPQPVKNDFFVDTKSHCFLCLNKINYEGLSSPDCSFYSFHPISRYLKMDKTKVFNRNVPIPSHLLKLVKKSQLKVELCEVCGGHTEKFSSLHKRLERIQMELTSCLRDIQRRMISAEEFGLTIRFRTSSEQNSLDLEKVNIVERVRSEALQKCSARLNAAPPRVLIPMVKDKTLLLQNVIPKTTFDDGDGGTLNSKRNGPGRPKKHPGADPEQIRLYKKQYQLSYYKKRKLGLIRPTSKRINVNIGAYPPCNDNAEQLENGTLKCKICSKIFVAVSYFKIHFEGVHLNLRNFACDFCPKKFNFETNLRVHRNSMHLGKYFSCVCGSRQPTRAHLMKHQRSCKLVKPSDRLKPVYRVGRPKKQDGQRANHNKDDLVRPRRPVGRPKKQDNRQEANDDCSNEEVTMEQPVAMTIKVEPGLFSPPMNSSSYAVVDTKIQSILNGDYLHQETSTRHSLQNGSHHHYHHVEGEDEENEEEEAQNIVQNGITIMDEVMEVNHSDPPSEDFILPTFEIESVIN